MFNVGDRVVRIGPDCEKQRRGGVGVVKEINRNGDGIRLNGKGDFWFAMRYYAHPPGPEQPVEAAVAVPAPVPAFDEAAALAALRAAGWEVGVPLIPTRIINGLSGNYFKMAQGQKLVINGVNVKYKDIKQVLEDALRAREELGEVA